MTRITILTPGAKTEGACEITSQNKGLTPKLTHSAHVNGRGRRPTTSHGELDRIAFALFEQHGFEATTVYAIIAVAGISPCTFFRYFETKK